MATPDDPDDRAHGNSPTDHLLEGFEPAPLPAAATDPTKPFDPAPTQPLRHLPISLCSLGPCANYHEIVSQVDAQEPLDGTKGRIFLHVIRTCYPHSGIEMPLTAPVQGCNKWSPVTVTASSQVDQDRTHTFKRNRPYLWNAFLTSWNGATFNHNDDQE